MARSVLRGIGAAALIAMAIVTAAVSAQQGTPPAANPDVTAALQRGETALQRKQYEQALDAFTAASKLDKTSAVALFGMGRAFHGLSAWKSEADALAEGLKCVGDDKKLEAQLHNQRGLAFAQLAVKPTDKALRDAEGEFRAVLVQTETLPIAWFNLGVVLLKQNRDPEGVAALQAFVDSGLRSPDVDAAKGMIENPRRARETYAPEFSIASLAGEYINLKDLQGKVVLLDFWGTWCGPCVSATPMLVDIAKSRAKDPRFKLVSISNDKPSDVATLRNFIEIHKMDWLQIHDTTQKVVRQYDVNNFPTYVVIDAEGIIRERVKGFGSSTRGTLDEAITTALRAMPKK